MRESYVIRDSHSTYKTVNYHYKSMPCSYLEKQAIRCPAAYLALLGKVLPLQVTGEDGGAIKIIGRVEIAPLTMNDDKTD
ncbi:hypothetical protein [Bartonella sp. TT121SHDZB]|uniref:hypothetical protein n=1 Tax=Bartonella sp. TT121SHDZB TaxID=3243580 RepID=UPI0035CF30C8